MGQILYDWREHLNTTIWFKLWYRYRTKFYCKAPTFAFYPKRAPFPKMTWVKPIFSQLDILLTLTVWFHPHLHVFSCLLKSPVPPPPIKKTTFISLVNGADISRSTRQSWRKSNLRWQVQHIWASLLIWKSSIIDNRLLLVSDKLPMADYRLVQITDWGKETKVCRLPLGTLLQKIYKLA